MVIGDSTVDAEHPKVIPMDLSSSHQVPSGPMTRARARALETEVTSLLSELPLSIYETWLLPQTETLCILRYLGEAKEQSGSEGEDGREDGQEEELPKKLQPPDDRSRPDVRHLEANLPKSQPAYALASGRPASTRRPASLQPN